MTHKCESFLIHIWCKLSGQREYVLICWYNSLGVHLADKDAYPPQGYPGGQGYGIGNPPPPQYQYPPHPQYVVQPPPHRNTQLGVIISSKDGIFPFSFFFTLLLPLSKEIKSRVMLLYIVHYYAIEH